MNRSEIRYWLVTILGGSAVLGAWIVLPVEEWLHAFGTWTARLGALGPIAFAALFVLATLLVVPGTPLTIAGGVAFGWWAMPLVMVAATLGSVLAYLAARSLLRARVHAFVANHPAMTATVEAVGDADWRLLTLMRLSPFVPFNAQNYALGLAGVGMPAFLVSTLAGMIPGTVLCVHLGVIGRAAGDDTASWIPLGLGLAATVAAVAMTRRRVQARLAARARVARPLPTSDASLAAGPGPDRRWLQPGATCWRQERAGRVAVLHDGAAYFAAARAALLESRHSVILIGWSFDPRLRLVPEGSGAPGNETMADLLRGLKARRPELVIRLLIWEMPWPIASGAALKPEAIRALLGPGIAYHLDATLPRGACQHQKILVIDDRVAFCGGGDFEANRWDTPAHRDRDPRRRLPTGEAYPPRHEIMMVVDRAAAAALGDLARRRWRDATGERLLSSEAWAADPWPAHVTPLLTDVPVALVRTMPAHGGREGIRENQALYAAAIAGARRTIYLENQYFTAPLIAEALAARLAEPDGPEIVVVVAERSPNGFDRLTMDTARRVMIARLLAADRYGRLRILAPRTPGGRTILVHSKVAIFDDRLLRIGSTNLNNRSLGYDSECDLAIEVPPGDAHDATRIAVARLRDGLVAHHAGCPRELFEEAVRTRGSLCAVLDDPALVAPQRLCAVIPSRRGLLARLIAAWHLGDPVGVADAWRPWRRQSELRRLRDGNPHQAVRAAEPEGEPSAP
ncbi:VTT domain-containing protein [Methylobacterium goesingense]|uniref:Phospholipase D n=1 Tax=Methylobacterium goesingense TaxID=243690 RepID=A0ABV2L573_9HYPH|nr:VTT domain-containing protein [Methylobacterium goesingense]GJD72059.1 Cardiolipin synthase B [Methylobacterium goesingense]